MSLKRRPARQGQPGDHICRETEYQKPENQLKSGFVRRETPLADKLLYERLQGKAYQGPTTSLTRATMNPGPVAAYPGGQVKPGEPSSVHHGNLMSASPDQDQPSGQPQTARPAPAKTKDPVAKQKNNSSGRCAIPVKRKKASKRKGKQTKPEVQPEQLCEPDQEILFNELIRHRFLYLDFTCRLPRFRNVVFNRLPQRLQRLLVDQNGLQKRLVQLCKQGRRTLKTQGPLTDSQSPGNGLNQLIDTWNKIYWGRYYAEFRNGIEAGISAVNAAERGNEALDDLLGLSPDNVADISNFADIPDIDADHSTAAQDMPEERASSEGSSIPGDDDDDDDKATASAWPTLAYIVPVEGASVMLDGQHPFQPPKTRKGKKKAPPMQDARCSDQPRSNQPFTSDIFELNDTDGEKGPGVRSKETESGVPSSSSRTKRKRDCSSVGTVTHDSPMASQPLAVKSTETPTPIESARPTKKRKRKLPTTKAKAFPTAKDEVIVIASDDESDSPASQSHEPSSRSRSSAPRSGKHVKGKSASSPAHGLTQEMTPPHSTPCPKKSSHQQSNTVSSVPGENQDSGKRLHDSPKDREEEGRRISKKESKKVKEEPRDEEQSDSSEDEGNTSKCNGKEERRRELEQQVKQQKQRKDKERKKGEKETNKRDVRERAEGESREREKKMRNRGRGRGKRARGERVK
ncbi:unnamed protein product [Clonostachys solani]|uniref:Uncharacterized protein n=1 Tax=Clonostachys solani TaxID=160281 RepID=A0A9N9Z890_9HYPO|nr:unnamed protein product [Clonostachys solani]